MTSFSGYRNGNVNTRAHTLRSCGRPRIPGANSNISVRPCSPHTEFYTRLTIKIPVPDGVFPDTLHSQLGKPLHVTFPGSTPHELIFIGEDRRPHHRIFIPEYMFMHPETRVKFQSDVRNKDLHCTFDTDIISTDLHPRDHGGLAVMQDLKIWQDRRTSLHSISFCTRDNEHFQFSILGFPRVRSTEKKAHLTRDQVLLESSEWRKHSSVASARPIVRKPSVWDFVTKTLQFRSLNAAPKSQLRPQEINKLIEKSNSPPDDTGDPTSARPTGPKHIRICFSKTEMWSAEQGRPFMTLLSRTAPDMILTTLRPSRERVQTYLRQYIRCERSRSIPVSLRAWWPIEHLTKSHDASHAQSETEARRYA